MILRLVAIVGMGLYLSTAVFAAPLAVVKAIQQEATVQLVRGSEKKPVQQGTELQAGDVITTGEKARVLVRFFDDSVIKIGQNATIRLDEIAPPTDDKTGLQGTLSVVGGYMRFNSQDDKKRNVTVNVGNTITAGIRGTDVFFGSIPEREAVCLLEGKVEVKSGELETTLTKPREFLLVPRGEAAKPIAFASDEQVQKWLTGTELQ